MSYSGLGHLVQSSFSQHGRALQCGPSSSYSVTEEFRYDALGNRTTLDRSELVASSGGCSLLSSAGSGAAYASGTARLTQDTTLSGVTTYTYNEAGEIEFSQNLGGPAEEKALFYGADGNLRAADTRRAAGPNPAFGFWTRAFDEYRYDALGRRVWARSRKSCQPTDMSSWEATECKTSTLRRVVWDGDQVLVEIQMPGDSTPRDIPYWENDTAEVRLPPFESGQGLGDPSRYFGRVIYAHGSGIDRPVAVTRYNYVYALDQWGAELPEPIVVKRVSIMPFWNHLGDAPWGAFENGAEFVCSPPDSTTRCMGVVWPYKFSAYDRERGIGRDNWHGSLLEGSRDPSGMQYKRNRYYDPQTGRFTQEDPIGLAGGLNLYSFANSDPVNFTDPFGLCPRCFVIAARAAQAVGRGLRALGNLFRRPGAAEATARLAAGPADEQLAGVVDDAVGAVGRLTQSSAGQRIFELGRRVGEARLGQERAVDAIVQGLNRLGYETGGRVTIEGSRFILSRVARPDGTISAIGVDPSGATFRAVVDFAGRGSQSLMRVVENLGPIAPLR